MKNLPQLLVLFFVITIFASCGSSPYKKRKACRGNGSWSGKRNLGAVDQSKAQQQMFVLATKDEEIKQN